MRGISVPSSLAPFPLSTQAPTAAGAGCGPPCRGRGSCRWCGGTWSNRRGHRFVVPSARGPCTVRNCVAARGSLLGLHSDNRWIVFHHLGLPKGVLTHSRLLSNARRPASSPDPSRIAQSTDTNPLGGPKMPVIAPNRLQKFVKTTEPIQTLNRK